MNFVSWGVQLNVQAINLTDEQKVMLINLAHFFQKTNEAQNRGKLSSEDSEILNQILNLMGKIPDSSVK